MKRILYLLMPGMLIPIILIAQENRNLFNGEDLNNWKVLNGDAEYRIEENQIIGISKYGTPNTFLATKQQYTNFILEYEMKIDNGLNSGVQIRSHSDNSVKNGRVQGLQVECDDSQRGWSGGLFDEARMGWKYPLEYNPKAKSAFKKGRWNKYKVLAYENYIFTWVNGIMCANLVEEEIETGFIALQIHQIKNKELEGREIKWRNITIKEADRKDFEKIDQSDAPQVSFLKNKLTQEELNNGWKLLWDGKTTNNWRGARLASFPEHRWKINDGILSVMSSDGGESTNGWDIVTTDKYKNFILEVDFRLSEGANSGIKYFVDIELNKGKGSSIGCEFQILDDKLHPDAKKGVNGNRTLGSLYDLIKANGMEHNPFLPKEKYVNKIGQWNRAKIEVRGNHVVHFLNGCKVVEYERGTQMWRALKAFSKYSEWPNFGEYEEGNILLQDHGDYVSFKNIKIKELP